MKKVVNPECFCIYQCLSERMPGGNNQAGAEQCQVQGSCHAKSLLYCGPKGPTASIFYGIWIIQSGATVFILNLDKISLKKLFPTMNI